MGLSNKCYSISNIGNKAYQSSFQNNVTGITRLNGGTNITIVSPSGLSVRTTSLSQNYSDTPPDTVFPLSFVSSNVAALHLYSSSRKPKPLYRKMKRNTRLPIGFKCSKYGVAGHYIGE